MRCPTGTKSTRKELTWIMGATWMVVAARTASIRVSEDTHTVSSWRTHEHGLHVRAPRIGSSVPLQHGRGMLPHASCRLPLPHAHTREPRSRVQSWRAEGRPEAIPDRRALVGLALKSVMNQQARLHQLQPTHSHAHACMRTTRSLPALPWDWQCTHTAAWGKHRAHPDEAAAPWCLLRTQPNKLKSSRQWAVCMLAT